MIRKTNKPNSEQQKIPHFTKYRHKQTTKKQNLTASAIVTFSYSPNSAQASETAMKIANLTEPRTARQSETPARAVRQKKPVISHRASGQHSHPDKQENQST
ncbi:hypothetical protein P3T43_005384 [Paraburkholderia sp. GAS41]|uniref:hypothetical protein n=1 Tax=Paraburkholderia sp. GAS41 TaxID=3035134 RepID=UPI003D1AEE66